MTPNVLVATPMRDSLTAVLRDRCDAIYEALTYPHKERALYVNDTRPVPGSGKYAANAIVRNALIDRYLADEHTHVLWIDADLVRVPANLIERLIDVSDSAVVAPLPYVERIDPSRGPSVENGGWFYDTGAFIWRGQGVPCKWDALFLHQPGDVLELDSVGTCYLIPADVYRQGARYSTVGGAVEHVALMAEARTLGYRVLALRALIIEHAYLPKYGEAWH